MSRAREQRRKFIAKTKKNRFSNTELKGQFKYYFDNEERKLIIDKIPRSFFDIIYSNPLPNKIEKLCKEESITTSGATTFNEALWYFETLILFTIEIKKFISLNDSFECSILTDRHLSSEILQKQNLQICYSYYNILSEMLLNEENSESGKNKEIISNFDIKNFSSKLLILLDFNRLKMDKSISAWQYDSIINQHKKIYPTTAEDLLEYVDLKLNPFRSSNPLKEIGFLFQYDSDFSIIDRYNSLKIILPEFYFYEELKQHELEKLSEHIKSLYRNTQDFFWYKILTLQNVSVEFENSNREFLDKYFLIQDLHFQGEYKEVVSTSVALLNEKPNFSDIYIFFIEAIIISGDDYCNYFEEGTLINEILGLIFKILKKEETYLADRDKLLNRFYSISHLGFSTALLEFLYNEYNLEIPQYIKRKAYLESQSFRYNSFSVVDLNDNYFDLPYYGSNNGKVSDFLKSLTNKEINYPYKYESFFSFKILVNFHLKKRQTDKALRLLKEVNLDQWNNHQDKEFIRTWINKKILKCCMILGKLNEIANLIVDNFFIKNVAYDHYFDQKFIEQFAENNSEDLYKEITIPILFEIYNQPQTLIYDTIVDFLISQDVEKPSELITKSSSFEENKFIYFLEKVCTRENIQDSPFLNTINQLEEERILILNYLKEINPTKISDYNNDILQITKEASIRKGLLQIHESRIYVDTTNIYKSLEAELPEIFDRYLELTDIKYSALSTLKLNEKFDPDSITITYYFLEPIPEKKLYRYLFENNPTTDPNAVIVPIIRFTYFVNIFEKIKDSFVFDEDYGFKSFLSMRIRHGTFANVLRSIFDKYHIISSKESDSENYKEVEYWNIKLEEGPNPALKDFQNLIKKFSEEIDNHIDTGLSWISIKKKGEPSEAMFDFDYTEDQLYGLYHNRFGRINDYEVFVNEVFTTLFERLEIRLDILRDKINTVLSGRFLTLLENFEKGTEKLQMKTGSLNLIEQELISCKTEIQLITTQIVNWFKISKNQYIEEFPIDMILQTTLNYIDSINRNAIRDSILNINNSCDLKFKGKYFESFGDIFINLFDNIISKNKELGNNLEIDINIKNENDNLFLTVKNNLPENVDLENLKKKVEEIHSKVENYKKGSLVVSFEEGSGYLKICKCISVDLEREFYTVHPKVTQNHYEVQINFPIQNLV